MDSHVTEGDYAAARFQSFQMVNNFITRKGVDSDGNALCLISGLGQRFTHLKLELRLQKDFLCLLKRTKISYRLHMHMYEETVISFV